MEPVQDPLFTESYLEIENFLNTNGWISHPLGNFSYPVFSHENVESHVSLFSDEQGFSVTVESTPTEQNFRYSTKENFTPRIEIFGPGLAYLHMETDEKSLLASIKDIITKSEGMWPKN